MKNLDIGDWMLIGLIGLMFTGLIEVLVLLGKFVYRY